mmetsp:Transcript_2501/g.5880  ORF Transcript_2501/g.5880 Transcript_2501/m.5880 type:complete len:316 (-) Transcript_2501:34-981(-)
MSLSLNDIDAQIEQLGESEASLSPAESDGASGSGGEEGSSPEPPPELRPEPPPEPPKKRRATEEAAEAAGGPRGRKKERRTNASPQAPPPRPPQEQRKRGALQASVCFRFLREACKFDDCKFRHIRAAELTPELTAGVLRELPLRKFDQKLADVIRDLNIPRCKDFHQYGNCTRREGQCHYWHLTSAAVAKWAGFNFWCEPCSKAFTSEEQMREHEKGRPHLTAIGATTDRGGGRGTNRSGRSSRGRGPGVGSHGASNNNDKPNGNGRGRGVAAPSDSSGRSSRGWGPGRRGTARAAGRGRARGEQTPFAREEDG